MQYFPVAYFLEGYPCWNEYVTDSANQWKFQRWIHTRYTQHHVVLVSYCATADLIIYLNKRLLNLLRGLFFFPSFHFNLWKFIGTSLCAREYSWWQEGSVVCEKVHVQWKHSRTHAKNSWWALQVIQSRHRTVPSGMNLRADSRNKLSQLSEERTWKQLIGWKVLIYTPHQTLGNNQFISSGISALPNLNNAGPE